MFCLDVPISVVFPAECFMAYCTGMKWLPTTFV